MPGRRILHDSRPFGSDGQVIIDVVEVPVSEAFPEGVKLSFVYLRERSGRQECVHRVDNERGKGLHEHLGSDERALPWRPWRALLRDFRRRCDELRGDVA